MAQDCCQSNVNGCASGVLFQAGVPLAFSLVVTDLRIGKTRT